MRDAIRMWRARTSAPTASQNRSHTFEFVSVFSSSISFKLESCLVSSMRRYTITMSMTNELADMRVYLYMSDSYLILYDLIVHVDDVHVSII